MPLSWKERYWNWTKWINAIHIWALHLVKFYIPDGLHMNTRQGFLWGLSAVKYILLYCSYSLISVYIPFFPSPKDIFPYVRESQRLLLCFLHRFMSSAIHTLKQLLQSCFPETKQYWCNEKKWKRPFTLTWLLQPNHSVVLTLQRSAYSCSLISLTWEQMNE